MLYMLCFVPSVSKAKVSVLSERFTLLSVFCYLLVCLVYQIFIYQRFLCCKSPCPFGSSHAFFFYPVESASKASEVRICQSFSQSVRSTVKNYRENFRKCGGKKFVNSVMRTVAEQFINSVSWLESVLESSRRYGKLKHSSRGCEVVSLGS